MLRSGQDYLESLRDGRMVYIGGERVQDVITHPAFRNAARSCAAIYDMKSAPENRARLAFEEDGEHFSHYFLPARSRLDLEKRTEIHRAIAGLTHGLFGRSPDHVASFVTGMVTNAEAFGPYRDNLLRYYDYMRRNDIYAAYAIIPPQTSRLRVVSEEDDGVVLSGMKMLATGAVFANELWIGNITPLSPDQADQSITCAIPVNAPGLALWSRMSFERSARSRLESPLAHDFDETDSMVIFNRVKVPWERVFVHNDAQRARQIYIETAGHCYGNHQSNVRFWAKMQLLSGLASCVAKATGADQSPAVRETLGRLAAQEALIGAAVLGQIQGAEDWPDGFTTYNRRFMYAALNWCTESHSAIIDCIRELCGGNVFQMPADGSVFDDDDLSSQFEHLWQAPHIAALDRMKLFKLAWDLIGSEFAGRHMQYEKFYAGSPFVVRNDSFTHAPWQQFEALVDGVLDRGHAKRQAAE